MGRNIPPLSLKQHCPRSPETGNPVPTSVLYTREFNASTVYAFLFCSWGVGALCRPKTITKDTLREVREREDDDANKLSTIDHMLNGNQDDLHALKTEQDQSLHKTREHQSKAAHFER